MAWYKLGIRFTNVIFFLFFIEEQTSAKASVFPNKQIVTEWAREVSAVFDRDYETSSGYLVLTKAYNSDGSKYLKPASTMQLKFEKISPQAILRDVESKLSKMLARKMEALNTSVMAAEKAAVEHHWKNKISKDDVEYLSTNTLKKDDPRLAYSDRFKQFVITNMSIVHIPIEIYDGDVEILNGLQWSSALDDVFMDNYEKDPEILWQYFGSQTGFMRTLPAAPWNNGNVDLFDVRRRPWYTQGASSPKDMMILIDTSGSIFGQALELVKVAVTSLLDTLGENDFVNIAKFNEEASFVTNCFNGSFVQANYRNKKKFIEAVTTIQAEGMANFKAGLSFAFEQLEKLKNGTGGEKGAGCNRMIMLLTDGGTEHAEDVFNKYNPKGNQTYRVFTYAIGPTANPIAAVKWMACANKGFFSQIPAMGAIRSKVQEHMDKPKTFKRQLKQRFHHTIKVDRTGLGMMTTVTLPVYNKTANSTNQTILGVMGIDVTTEQMLKYVPHRLFGSNGFPFAINANGYILFHPNLRVQPTVKDPPNVDFLEVESEFPMDKKTKLRKDMIDMKEGYMEMETYTVSSDMRHVDIEFGERKRRYAYKGIGGTTFSLGVSFPMYHQYYLKVKADLANLAADDTLEEILNASNTATLIPNWNYYANLSADPNFTGTLLDLSDALTDLIKNGNSTLKWDEELRDHLLWDVYITSIFNSYWINAYSMTNGMLGAFIATNGGLTRISPKSSDLVQRFMGQRDTWKANYFKRSIDSPNIMFSAPFILKPSNVTADVSVFKSVVINNVTLDPTFNGSSLNYKVAVAGVVFSHESIIKRLVDVTTKMNANGNFMHCNNSDSVACYLLDDGAFLIATNQMQYNTSIGRFFGKIDPEIMYQLYNKSIYKRLEQYDYQAICDITVADGTVSAGTINLPSMTLLYEFLTFNWWSSVVTWTFTNFNLYNMLYPPKVVEASDFEQEYTKPCIQKTAQYYFTELLREGLDGQTECQLKSINCSRDFIAVEVQQTNLLLVVAETEKMDCEACRLTIKRDDIIQEPVESKPELCKVKPRYRRAVDDCYDYDNREDATRCGASLTHPVSMVMTCLVTMATWLLIQL